MRGVGVRGWGVAGALWLLLQAPACAADLRLAEGRFHHAEHGFSLEDPRALAPDAGWRRVELEGATLAFRGPSGAALALLARCGRDTRADARSLSRHLLFALEERRVVEEGPLPGEEGEAYRRVVRARAGEEPVRLETVTRVAGGCTYDWLLVTRGEPGPAGALFERWRSSFRRAARPAEGRAAEPGG